MKKSITKQQQQQQQQTLALYPILSYPIMTNIPTDAFQELVRFALQANGKRRRHGRGSILEVLY
jgi:hypothetical protein